MEEESPNPTSFIDAPLPQQEVSIPSFPEVLQESAIPSMVESIRGSFNTEKTGFDRIQSNRQQSNFLTSLIPQQEEKITFKGDSFRLVDAYDKLSDGSYIPKYESFQQGVNNEEKFAQKQTSGEQWRNGAIKFLQKTNTAVIGGTLGSLYGIGEAITTGDWRAIMDNDFTDVLDDFDKRTNNNLANYYTEEEKNMGFGESMGTANFWADGFLGGLSFTVGAIASEAIWAAATGGASLTTTAARWGLRTSKLLNKVKASKAIGGKLQRYFTSKIPEVAGGVNSGIRAGRAAEVFNTVRMGYTSAGFEAGIEARMFKKEQEDMFYSYFDGIGREPTAQEIAKFDNDLISKTNGVFGTNLALVGASNLLLLGKTFNIANPISGVTKAFEKFVYGKGLEAAKEGGKQAIKRNVGQRVAGTLYNTFKNPVREGVFEEGLQAVTTTAAGAMLESSYNVNKDVLDFSGAVYEGLAHTYGTKEGWKEVGLGMLIGAFGGGGTALLQRQDPTASIRDSMRKVSKIDTKRAKDYNKIKFDELSKKMLEGELTETQKKTLFNISKANNLTVAAQQSKEASLRGDLAGVAQADKSGIMTNIMSANMMDLGQEAQEDLFAQIDATTNEQIAESRGITIEQAKEVKAKAKKDYTELKTKFERNREFSGYMVGNISNKELKKIRTELNLEGKEISLEGLRSVMAYQMTMADSMFEDAAVFNGKISEIIESYSFKNLNIKGIGGIKLAIDKAPQRVKAEIYNTSRRLKRAKENLEKINKEKEKFAFIVDVTPEAKQKTAIKMKKLLAKQVKEEQVIEKLRSHGKLLMEGVRVSTNTPIQTEELYVEQNIEDLLDALDKVEGHISEITKADPKKGLLLQAYIDAYNKSINTGKRNTEVMEGFLNKDAQLKGASRKFLTKLVEYNDPTKRILKGLIDEYNSVLGGSIKSTVASRQEDSTTEEEADIAAQTTTTRSTEIIDNHTLEDNGDGTYNVTTPQGNTLAKNVKGRKNAEDLIKQSREALDTLTAEEIQKLEEKNKKDLERIEEDHKTKVEEVKNRPKKTESQEQQNEINRLEAEKQSKIEEVKPQTTTTTKKPVKYIGFPDGEKAFYAPEATDSNEGQFYRIYEDGTFDFDLNHPQVKKAFDFYDTNIKRAVKVLNTRGIRDNVLSKIKSGLSKNNLKSSDFKVTPGKVVFNGDTIIVVEKATIEHNVKSIKTVKTEDLNNKKDIIAAKYDALIEEVKNRPQPTATPKQTLTQEQQNEIDKLEAERQAELNNKQKFVNSKKRQEKEGGEYKEISVNEIDLNASGMEGTEESLGGIKKIVVLEERGKNANGLRTGTIKVIGNEGNETYEVFFKDDKINTKYDAKIEEIKNRPQPTATPQPTQPTKQSEIDALDKQKKKKIDRVNEEYNKNVERVKKQNEVTPQKTTARTTIKQDSPQRRKIKEVLKDFKGVILKDDEAATGEEVLQNKPNEEEFDEYLAIVEQAKVDTDTLLGKNAKKFTNKYLKKVGLSRVQVERFQELSKKLSDWQLAETFGDEMTIRDLLHQEALFQKEAVKTTTTPLTKEEQDNITHEQVNVSVSDSAKVENINTQDIVVVKSIADGNKVRYELSQLNLEKIPQEELERLGIEIRREGDTIIIMRPNQEDFIVKTTGNSRYKFSSEDFKTFTEIMDIKIIPYKGQKTTWSGTYSKNKDGNYSLMDSNFEVLGGGIEVATNQELNEIEVGEELFFVVNLKGAFNDEIIQDAISDESKRTKKERKKIIEESTSILVVTKDGKVVGEVKAATQENHHTESTLALRKQAAAIMEAEIENYFKGEDSTTPRKQVKLPFKTTVKQVYANQPNVEVDSEGSIIQKKIPKNYKIEAFGIYKEGEIILSNNSTKIKKINKSYVQSFSKGVPVIVVKHGKQYIAYPMQLEGTSRVYYNEAQRLLNSDESNVNKINGLMRIALDAGISPKKYNLRYISQEENSFNETEVEARLLNELKEIKGYISEEDLLENTSKEELKEIATTALNLKDNSFRGTKIKMDAELVEDDNITKAQQKTVKISKADILKTITKLTLKENKIIVKKGEKLTEFENRVLSLQKVAIKKIIEEQIKMSAANKKNSKDNKEEPCK